MKIVTKKTQNNKYIKQSSIPSLTTIDDKEPLRPIHYLGSKLRILDFIKETIDQLDPFQGGVCDLFSGSGTVSKYLSATRQITAVDIQEYSRVICSALLNPAVINASNFIESCSRSEHYRKLAWCMEPMIEYENSCVHAATLLGNPILLCELVEKGSILSFEHTRSKDYSPNLYKSLVQTVSRLKEEHFQIGPEAIVSRYYGGLYFSYKQSMQIDVLLEYICKLASTEKDTYLAALLSTSSDIVNTVGKQFAQPIKPFNVDGSPKKNIVNRILKDREDDVFEIFGKWVECYTSQTRFPFNHEVYRMDYTEALDYIKKNQNISVVYADPPYTRYHYSRYYHVLETICLRDNPKVSNTCLNGGSGISRGIYREDRHQSPFCIKSKASAAFDIMFKKIRDLDASLVLSYSPYEKGKENTPRVQSIKQLCSMARKYYKNVELVSVGEFSHSKLNHSDKNFQPVYNAEILIVCRK